MHVVIILGSDVDNSLVANSWTKFILGGTLGTVCLSRVMVFTIISVWLTQGVTMIDRSIEV